MSHIDPTPVELSSAVMDLSSAMDLSHESTMVKPRRVSDQSDAEPSLVIDSSSSDRVGMLSNASQHTSNVISSTLPKTKRGSLVYRSRTADINSRPLQLCTKISTKNGWILMNPDGHHQSAVRMVWGESSLIPVQRPKLHSSFVANMDG